MPVSPCGGFCCERFRVGRYHPGLCPEEVEARLKEPGLISKGDRKLYEMLVYVEFSGVAADGEQGEPVHWWTCKHFNKETRLCMDYENRPAMCRNYNTDWMSACGLKNCKAPQPQRPDFSDSVEKEDILKVLDDVVKEIRP